MSDLTHYLNSIQSAYPELIIENARLHAREGQFSDVLFVNEALVFRFPRTSDVAADMAREIPLLKNLQGRLPLPIPNPQYAHYADGQLVFMGYSLLPGAPLWNETLDAITDEAVRDRLAAQLAGFLKALHAIPPHEIIPNAQPAGTRAEWQAMYAEMRAKLFPYMRPDAREQVTAHFENALNDATLFDFEPVLRHGDFGTGNILYDAQTQSISGVIDFSFAGYGDPAQDAGALANYGEDFMRRCVRVYPALQTMPRRVAFIRGTYALQQALYALRDGNQDDFDDGIRDFI